MYVLRVCHATSVGCVCACVLACVLDACDRGALVESWPRLEKVGALVGHLLCLDQIIRVRVSAVHDERPAHAPSGGSEC